jgi:hypothetical protein
VTIEQMSSREMFRDEFTTGLRHDAPDAPWSLRPAGPLAHGDGTMRATSDGLTVESGGTHPTTGLPAFTWLAEPGQDDHIKWSVFARGTAPHGFPGFPVDQVLTCAAVMSARTFGTAEHPFGDAVDDPDADPRLAAAALIVADIESRTIFDFLLTNTAVYAFYERLGGFSYAVPVAHRTPSAWHDLAVRYDRPAGVVQWWVDGAAVLTVERIGQRCLDPRYLVLDHGGAADPVAPRQLTVGMGMLTLLDATGPDGGGLTRRLWGQGVRMAVRRIAVSATEPTPAR